MCKGVREHDAAGPIGFAALAGELQQHGIAVFVPTMFGQPGHGWEQQVADLEHALRLAPAAWQWSIMTPYPGTPLCDELAAKDRRLHPEVTRADGNATRWVDFDGMTPQVRLPGVAPARLRGLLEEAARRAYAQGGPLLLDRLGVWLEGARRYRTTRDPLLRRLTDLKARVCSRGVPLLLAYAHPALGLDAAHRERARELARRIVLEVRRAARPSVLERAAAEVLVRATSAGARAGLGQPRAPDRAVVNRARGRWAWA